MRYMKGRGGRGNEVAGDDFLVRRHAVRQVLGGRYFLRRRSVAEHPMN